jgi:hypothetical protein
MYSRQWRRAPWTFTLVCAWLLHPSGAEAAPPKEPTTAKEAPASATRGDGGTAVLEQTVSELRREQRRQKELIKKLEKQYDEQTRQMLKLQADAMVSTGDAAAAQADQEQDTQKRTFNSGARALQALNPEISVVADMFGQLIANKDGYAGAEDRSGFVFRTLGFHIQSNLDPFSFAKFAVVVSPEGVELEEGYITWTSVLPGLSATFGRFRQQFGVVNRWHDESLDQVDFPLAMRTILGDEGLNQVGLSLAYLVPKFWPLTHEIVLQVTNGENEQLFAGQFFSRPATLVHFKSYLDLSAATYFELGLSGMLGWNNTRGRMDDAGELQNEPWRKTWVFGADWTLRWFPPQRARYRGFVARGELYGARKELPGGQLAEALGIYQYLEARLSQRWLAGARFDWAMPLQANNKDTYLWSVTPYLTWWQSEFVRMRLQYAWTRSDLLADDDHRVLLQLTFAAGPHKHERY